MKDKKEDESKRRPLWVFYKVTWKFLTSLCGQTPSDPDIVKKWLEARQPRVRPPGGRDIDEINEEVFNSLESGEEPQEINKLVFQRVDGFLCMRASTIRAHLKDCARQISTLYVGKVQGEKAFSTKVINGVYPHESMYWIPITRDGGGIITEADGERVQPVHATGPRGMPINAIKIFEYVNNARMEFVLKVLGDAVKEKELHTLFQYGGTHGYAGERSAGEGKYEYNLERLGEIYPEMPKKALKDISTKAADIPAGQVIIKEERGG